MKNRDFYPGFFKLILKNSIANLKNIFHNKLYMSFLCGENLTVLLRNCREVAFGCAVVRKYKKKNPRLSLHLRTTSQNTLIAKKRKNFSQEFISALKNKAKTRLKRTAKLIYSWSGELHPLPFDTTIIYHKTPNFKRFLHFRNFAQIRWLTNQ